MLQVCVTETQVQAASCWYQRSEVRGQRSEVRGQRSEVTRQSRSVSIVSYLGKASAGVCRDSSWRCPGGVWPESLRPSPADFVCLETLLTLPAGNLFPIAPGAELERKDLRGENNYFNQVETHCSYFYLQQNFHSNFLHQLVWSSGTEFSQSQETNF